MDLATRKQQYAAIEAARGRPLIVYATSTRVGAAAMMAGDAVREFIDQIDAITTGTEVDILIHSTGGDGLAAWKLMSVLRERFERVGVLVPSMAFSAATVFAMGADEIVMHPHASLGPIDPQIGMKLPDGSTRGFAFEDVGAFLRFVKSEVGLTEQEHVPAAIDRLFAVVDPVHIGAAKRASELSTDIGERLLQTHMKSVEGRAKARKIAEQLNKKFFAHGDAVSRSRARELELKVAKSNVPLEKLVWSAFLGIEAYMDLRLPFNPLTHYLTNGGAAAIAPTAPLALPPNTPAQLAQQVWNQAATAALQGLSAPGTEVEFSLVQALVESTRHASEFRSSGAISATRMPGGDVQLSVVQKEANWRTAAAGAPAGGVVTGGTPRAPTE